MFKKNWWNYSSGQDIARGIEKDNGNGRIKKKKKLYWRFYWQLSVEGLTPSTALYLWVYTAQFTIKERLAKHAHGNIYIQTAISPLTQMTKTCVLPLFRLFEVLIKWSIIQSTNLTIFFHITWFGPVWKGLERLRPLASLIFLFEHNRNILRVCQRVIIRSQSLLIQHI